MREASGGRRGGWGIISNFFVLIFLSRVITTITIIVLFYSRSVSISVLESAPVPRRAMREMAANGRLLLGYLGADAGHSPCLSLPPALE